ncbi:RNA polymerase II elongation factor [Cyanidiococcus yangmingshanensis]|uniref:RNA polymerase II elongation factor n=1 Tax=Cyanidiococcus yangmingshanensis TaxID=2690220 RepID=A0A7J7IRR2_9RHOD|nr:RNA polymerase II elongation factor [Cyanidiococcus yangmingshanensis]
MEHVSWEPSLGSYVWAKLPSYPWWPGIVAPDTNGHHRRGNRYNVNFYNDTQHAWVARENLVSFAENMDKCVKPTHRLYAAVQKAIAEAIQDGALQSTRLSSDEPAPKPGLSRETELGKALDQESEDTEQSIAAAAESMNEKTRSRSAEAPPSSAPTLKRLKQKRKIPADDSDGTETAGSSSEYDAVHDPEESDASLVQSDDDSMANAKGRARAAKTHSSRQRRAPRQALQTRSHWTT